MPTGPWDDYKPAANAPSGPWDSYKTSDAPVSTPDAPVQHSALGIAAHGVGAAIGSSPIGQAVSGIAAIPHALAHPVDTVTGAAQGIGQGIHDNYQGLKRDLGMTDSDGKQGHFDLGSAWSDFIGTAPVVGPMLKEAGERLGNAFAGKLNQDTGKFDVDPYEVSGAVGHAAGLALTAATAAQPKAALKDAKKVVGGVEGGGIKAVKGAKYLTEKAIDLNSKNASFGQMMMSGLRGSATRPGMLENLDNYAGPAIRDAMQSTGKGIHNGLDDLIDTNDAAGVKQPGILTTAKQQVQAKINGRTGIQKAGGMMIDGRKLGDAIRGTITQKMKIENPGMVSNLERMADEYSYVGKTKTGQTSTPRQFTVDEAYSLLGDTNDELNTYYGKNPTAQRVSAGSNPDIAHQVALGNALRDTLYKWDSDPALGDELRTLRKQYGTLTELEDSLYRRRNVALRAAPVNLSSQISKWSSIGDAVSGIAKLGTSVFSENPAGKAMSGVKDLGKAASQLTVAKWMQDYISTDSMIKRAFAKPIKPSPVP